LREASTEGAIKLRRIEKRSLPMQKLTIALVVLLALTACETTKGIGRDVQNAGEALDRTF
jgi:predicted small secreted protein